MKNVTLQNVYEHRTDFEAACKKAGACKPEYKKLIKAKTKAKFMKIIYNNFNWVYDELTKFMLKYNENIEFIFRFRWQQEIVGR